MLGFTTKSPDRAAAVARLRGWTKARFALSEADTVMVSELACSVPGCPPIETHVVFWTAAGRHHFRSSNRWRKRAKTTCRRPL
jgi:nitrate reductase molybdenum cofactor assembly chaperone NarJ/NarW